MTINQGTSTDMATINEPASATQFVESPDVQEFADLYTPRQVLFAPGDAPQDEDVDVSDIDDENDLSWSDVTKTVSNLGNKVKDLSQTALQYLGLSESKKPTQINISEKSKKEVDKKDLSKIVQPHQQSNQTEKSLNDLLKDEKDDIGDVRIKNLQSYFKNPDSNLKVLLGGKIYTGPVDGKLNKELQTMASSLESTIANIIDNKSVHGVVLKTDAADIKEAVAKVVAFKNYSGKDKIASLKLDDRMIKLAQILRK